MSEETVQTTEAAPTTTPVTTEAPVSEASTTPVETAQQTAPQYNPNYKFTAYDKEYEFIDDLKPFITNPELEKKVRELHEKAYALDTLKSKYERARTERDEVLPYREKYSSVENAMQELGQFINNGDFDSYFDSLQIPKEAIYEWVKRKVDELQMPEPFRNELEAKRQAASQAYSAQQQAVQFQQRLQQEQVRNRELELNMLMQNPQVSEFAQQFDARAGRPGAFRSELIRTGRDEWNTSQKDISPMEALEQTVKNWAPFLAQNQQPQPTPTIETQPVVQTPSGQKKPVLPNVQGSGASPLKKNVKSLKELRTLADSM